MDENTLTLVSQANINESAESNIFDFAERRHNIDLKKKDLDQLIRQFNFRREQLFHHIEEFSQTKNAFINKSNIFFGEHQLAINNLKDEIRIQKQKLESNIKNKEKVQEKIRLTLLSIETQNFNLRKLERTEKEIEEQMSFFQKIFNDSDIFNNQAQKKEKRMKQIQKLIKDSETSIERYENLILKYELQISELKLKINECYEKQTNMNEQKNTILAKDKFHFVAIQEKINQMKISQTSNYNDDTNNIQLIEIGNNKIYTEQKIIDITNKLKSTNERLNEIKEEIQIQIKDIINYHQLIEKPNKAIQKLRSRRIKRENFVKSKHDQFVQLKNKMENKKKSLNKRISVLKNNELQLNSELKILEENILNEELKEKELSLQNDILTKENEKSRKIEIIQTKKSIELLDQIHRKIELQKAQDFQCTINFNFNINLKSNSNSSRLNNENKDKNNENLKKRINTSKSINSKSCSNQIKLKSDKDNSNISSELLNNKERNSKTDNKANSKSRFFSNSKSPIQKVEPDTNEKLESQIHQTIEETNQLRTEYSKAKQKNLRQHIEFQLFQLNNKNSEEDDDFLFKEIEKKIADGRLLYLQRITEMSSENKEIELLIQKKLDRIESIKNKLHNLKNEEDTKNDLVVTYSPLIKKNFDYQADSVSRHEMINWLFFMIKKEKEEWLRFHNNASITSLLQVWNEFLDRM